ncbi:flagellin [Paracoccaceae bacterium]|nr:flagellin [Paracoccaceae bacterium]
MISINTNYGGLFASKAASQSQRTLDTAMERLSSGMRINYAKDDAAGQAISTRLTAEVQGLEMASRNAADAQSLIDTAEGALQESHNILLRMRELAVQSANGTMNGDDRAATNAEYQQMLLELDRISNTTSWGGVNLLDGSNATLTFQIGEDGTSAHRISVSFNDMDGTILGLRAHDRGPNNVDDAPAGAGGGDDASLPLTDLTSQANAQSAIARVDVAIQQVSSTRATFGAVSNRLSSTITNLDQISVNLSSSKGRIQDADFAAETSNLAKGQILQQAATAMLAQANASKQNVLALVR